MTQIITTDKVIYKKLLLVCLAFLTISVQGQTTFKKFKDTKTGAITAYADGFTAYKYSKEFINGEFQEVAIPIFEIQPRYNGGKFYLKLSSNEITQLGDFENIWRHCFHNQDFSGNCKILLYLKLDDERVLKLVGNGTMRNHSEINSFKFSITTKDIKAISTATNISVSIETTALDDFENFPYSFTNEDLNGFREFCDGMKL